ncbi:MAG: protein kinase [Myxococcales bacterium]|nr:protein kinase [Myxococcales bacterium]
METADTGALPPPPPDEARGAGRAEDDAGGRPPLPAEPVKPGDTLGGRFVLDERLGEDGVGTAWQAVDERSGKRIVILLFNPAIANDRSTTEKLRAAVKEATALNHRNIVGTFGVGKEGSRRYLAREHVDGRPLTAVLERKAEAGKRFGLKGAYNLVAHVCNALIGAGDLGHGTLRPSAVFISRSGRVRVAEFGLAEVRGALAATASRLDRWDRAFPVGTDVAVVDADMRALGLMLLSLLAGRPATEALLNEVREGLPADIVAIIGRAIDRTRPDALPDPKALKQVLSEAVAVVRDGGDESLEVVSPGGPPPAPTAALPPPPDAPAVPGLAGDVEDGPADDGSLQRWLVDRGGTDFGPFNRKEVVKQLFDEEITADTTLYDLETDRRLGLAEFPAFEEDLRAWAHEKAEREKKRAEAAARARARRRNRILFLTVGLPLLLAGAGAGGFMWYQSTLPTPTKAFLDQLVTPIQGSLPAVSLPEELPETVAEKKARQKVESDAAATKRAQEEARQIAREARLAEQSELALGAGTGAGFDRAAFDRALQKRSGQLVKCLEDEARRDPSLHSVEVKVTVLPTGSLINTQLIGGSGRGNSCVRQALGGVKVPPFDGTNHKVTLPFQIR